MDVKADKVVAPINTNRTLLSYRDKVTRIVTTDSTAHTNKPYREPFSFENQLPTIRNKGKSTRNHAVISTYIPTYKSNNYPSLCNLLGKTYNKY